MTAKDSTHRHPEIRLKPGENLHLSGRSMKRIMPASSIGQGLVMGLVVGLSLGIISLKPNVSVPLVPAAIGTSTVLFGGLCWLVARMRWSWHQWWLTDKRLVVRSGLVGYQLQSVPLDRIVDVTLQASWWDRIWGLKHIQVRDMNSEVSASMHHSRGLKLVAVPDAESASEKILGACPGVASPPSEMGEVVSLLRQLVDKAS